MSRLSNAIASTTLTRIGDAGDALRASMRRVEPSRVLDRALDRLLPEARRLFNAGMLLAVARRGGSAALRAGRRHPLLAIGGGAVLLAGGVAALLLRRRPAAGDVIEGRARRIAKSAPGTNTARRAASKPVPARESAARQATAHQATSTGTSTQVIAKRAARSAPAKTPPRTNAANR